MTRILILGGTGDSAKLIPQLAAIPNVETIASLAGRTPKPNVPIVGRVRLGGFGGVAGLAQYMKDEQVDLLVDVTHPFAVQIKLNAAMPQRRSVFRGCYSRDRRGFVTQMIIGSRQVP